MNFKLLDFISAVIRISVYYNVTLCFYTKGLTESSYGINAIAKGLLL